MMRLFALLADHGKITNSEKFGDLGNGLREFKCHQIRMPCRFIPRRIVVVSHGFRKKKNRAPKQEIERAERILLEDQERERWAPVASPGSEAIESHGKDPF